MNYNNDGPPKHRKTYFGGNVVKSSSHRCCMSERLTNDEWAKDKREVRGRRKEYLITALRCLRGASKFSRLNAKAL
ncbi:hypothetical protein CEXT_503811, partial [Caerostris extrusa]